MWAMLNELFKTGIFEKAYAERAQHWIGTETSRKVLSILCKKCRWPKVNKWKPKWNVKKTFLSLFLQLLISCLVLLNFSIGLINAISVLRSMPNRSTWRGTVALIWRKNDAISAMKCLAAMPNICWRSMASSYRDHSNVIFVKEPIEQKRISPLIWEFIGRNHDVLCVQFARNRFTWTPICGSIWERTLRIAQSFAMSAEPHSNHRIPWNATCEDTRAIGRTSGKK